MTELITSHPEVEIFTVIEFLDAARQSIRLEIRLCA